MKRIFCSTMAAILILALALSGCGGGGGGNHSEGTENYKGKFAFASDRDYYTHQIPVKGLNIFMYDAGIVKALTTDNDGTVYCYPELSPDNSKVVYVKKSVPGGQVNGIYVMNADGTGVNSINYTPSTNLWGIYPTWTSDGRIIFYDYKNGTLYIATAGGTISATFTAHFGQPYSAVRMSPDGKQFIVEENGSHQLEIWDFNGTMISNQQIICANGNTGNGIYLSPSWSPDGKRILFVGKRDSDGGYGIFSIGTALPIDCVSNINNATRITTCTDCYSVQCSFSQDGRKIIFSDCFNGNYEIFSVNPNGTGKSNLTSNPAYDGYSD